MLIKFGWGEDPTPDDMPYRVESYSIEGATEHGEGLMGNIEPQRIEMKISIAPENAGAGVRVWDHGRDQHRDGDDEHNQGKIAIYRGEGVGQSVLEIRFAGSWIVQIDQTASAADDRTVLDIVVATTEIRMTAGDDGSDLIMRNQRRYGQVHRET
jgi:hypothetical protein